jgi:hypothetical protein
VLLDLRAPSVRREKLVFKVLRAQLGHKVARVFRAPSVPQERRVFKGQPAQPVLPELVLLNTTARAT